MDGGTFFVLIAIFIGILHKGIIPAFNKIYNRLQKLKRIENRMGYEISEWYANEDFK